MLNIPPLYYKMDEQGMLDYRNDNFLWVCDMKWMPVKKILDGEYQDFASEDGSPVTIFARGMGGDYWCFNMRKVHRNLSYVFVSMLKMRANISRPLYLTLFFVK